MRILGVGAHAPSKSAFVYIYIYINGTTHKTKLDWLAIEKKNQACLFSPINKLKYEENIYKCYYCGIKESHLQSIIEHCNLSHGDDMQCFVVFVFVTPHLCQPFSFYLPIGSIHDCFSPPGFAAVVEIIKSEHTRELLTTNISIVERQAEIYFICKYSAMPQCCCVTGSTNPRATISRNKDGELT